MHFEKIWKNATKQQIHQILQRSASPKILSPKSSSPKLLPHQSRWPLLVAFETFLAAPTSWRNSWDDDVARHLSGWQAVEVVTSWKQRDLEFHMLWVIQSSGLSMAEYHCLQPTNSSAKAYRFDIGQCQFHQPIRVFHRFSGFISKPCLLLMSVALALQCPSEIADV